MRFSTFLLLFYTILVAGCGDRSISEPKTSIAPFVKTVELVPAPATVLRLSGTVRARVESPLAFQVGGRIAVRLVDAGQKVQAGQALFQLDTRDLEQALIAARATFVASEAVLATIASDLARRHQLRQQYVISAQALEHAELAWREAKNSRDAAAARQAQARNALGYAQLQSPTSGVLIDVTGEQGQVVAAGQPVAMLAQAGAREVELYFPDHVTPPVMGEILLNNRDTVAIKLRETAGAVNMQGRTLRTRYTLNRPVAGLVLGSVVQARFLGAAVSSVIYSVPIGAIDERGKGAHVWRITEGRVESVEVLLLSLDGEHARIQGALAVGEHIAALGAHLLHDGMAVRKLAR